MSKILGISFGFHDSAASIIVDNQIMAAASEERFSRKKNDRNFPKDAISYCLTEAGIQHISELDAIVYHEKSSKKLLRITENFLNFWPRSFGLFSKSFPFYLKNNLNIERIIRDAFPTFKGKILYSEHHLSHAAFSFYTSSFKEAVILTIDGVGDQESLMVFHGEESHIVPIKKIDFPNSLGLFYSAITAFLGFEINQGEWKVMGLAAYGTPTYKDKVLELFHFHEDDFFQLNMSYFSFQYSEKRSFNKEKWFALFDMLPRENEGEIQQAHMDLACSFQYVLESLVLRIVKKLSNEFKTQNLVLGGGVFLNGILNNKIAKSKYFKNVFIPNAPGDDGASIGAALAVNYMYFPNKKSDFKLSPYLGPSFTDTYIESILKIKGLEFQKISSESHSDFIAQELFQGKVIALFQGKMEFGPRALGNRSILADPRYFKMKSILNSKIKFRESFRPFAPVVLSEFKDTFYCLDNNINYSFMSYVVDVKDATSNLIEAATHVDKTARVQVLSPGENVFLEKILKAFYAITNIPILINTSLNLNTEPIACFPEDAISSFLNSEIDLLILNNYLISSKIQFSQPRENRFLLRSFYHDKPFNQFRSSIDASKNIVKNNQIKNYPYLHDFLATNTNHKIKILDVGCGSGWFINSISHFYGINGVGLDLNPVALKFAKETMIYLLNSINNNFICTDLYDFKSVESFDLVNSLGVLHHTSNFRESLNHVASLVKPNGFLHIGLYHLFGRRPFLDYMNKFKNISDELAFEKYSELSNNMPDQKQHYSWYEDQVNHPTETLHTVKEIYEILGNEFQLMFTSVNNFEKISSLEELFHSESLLEVVAQKKLLAREFYPGFFTVWLKKRGS